MTFSSACTSSSIGRRRRRRTRSQRRTPRARGRSDRSARSAAGHLRRQDDFASRRRPGKFCLASNHSAARVRSGKSGKKGFQASKTGRAQEAAVDRHASPYSEDPQSLRDARLNSAPSRRENSCLPADPSGRHSFSVIRPRGFVWRLIKRPPAAGAAMRESATNQKI